MFFRKKRKKELQKIKKIIEHTVARNLCLFEARNLKNLTQEKLIDENEIVVSFTTYSKRIRDVHLVLESIAQQTILPNRVILWLAEDEFNLYDLPFSVASRVTCGLDIRFYKDIKSYKKIIPTLKKFPNSIIITLDDDIIYPLDTIELLLKEHKKYPRAIVGNRAHKVVYKKGKMSPYKKWEKEVKENSGNVFLTGCGAILYPPDTLHADVTNSDIFMSICPYADDIWLYFMAKLKGTEIRKASGRDFNEFVEVSSNNSSGLNKLNVDRGYNDKQIRQIIEHYSL